MSSGGDYKDYNKMGIRKASGSSERGGITGGGGGGGPTDDILYERVHTVGFWIIFQIEKIIKLN